MLCGWAGWIADFISMLRDSWLHAGLSNLFRYEHYTYIINYACAIIILSGFLNKSLRLSIKTMYLTNNEKEPKKLTKYVLFCAMKKDLP